MLGRIMTIQAKKIILCPTVPNLYFCLAYTASTAGEQGFLQLLPIYLDHILYPTMSKAAFVTEVQQAR